MSKAEILGNIRRGLKRSEASAQQKSAVDARLSQHQNNLIPRRAQLPHEEQVGLFIAMANEAAAEVIELDNMTQVADQCCLWLAAQGITELVSASDSVLTHQNWPNDSTLQVQYRPAQAGDHASITTAFAGIAETGTLMLHSRSESPTTLNFLPDNHIAVLNKADIVGPYEDAWQKLRTHTRNVMPRTVNLITGPSRSADIEQRLQMGAHGPKQLLILIING